MTRKQHTVEAILGQLQTRVRQPISIEREMPALSFRLPPDLQTAGALTLNVGPDEADLIQQAVNALHTDLRTEHLLDANDAVRTFTAYAWADRATSHVDAFIRQHARDVLEFNCYIPVEYLTVHEPDIVSGVRLLPVDDPELATLQLKLDPPVGCAAAVPVSGTNYSAMARRAMHRADHALRVARTALRGNFAIHDQQLRFRTSTEYAFNAQLSGWSERPDIAYGLKFNEPIREAAPESPVWDVPSQATTDIERRAGLALRWMDRSRFTNDPLPCLLFLFFALESLLGDKSEGLKADGLAFRQMLLSHASTGAFDHPNRTWFLYDQIRSAAVHGEDVDLDVDDKTVQQFESSVRETLGHYLTYARDNGITKRGRLLAALLNHPDASQLMSWLRENGGSDWRHYFDKVLVQAPSAGSGPTVTKKS